MMCIHSQDSVYVLDEAHLAEKGIDFWENQKKHSRMNTEWWLNQLKERKAKRKKAVVQPGGVYGGNWGVAGGRYGSRSNNPSNARTALGAYNSKSKASPKVTPVVTANSNSGGNTRHQNTNNSVSISSSYPYPMGDRKDSVRSNRSDDSDADGDGDAEIEDSVIYHGDPDEYALSMNGPSPPIPSQIVMDDEALDHHESDAEEFQSLLNDYRAASKQLLESEKEKQQNMLMLNQQKDVIEEQNLKIQELQRQFAIFENTLKENASNSANVKSNDEVLEKLEESLSANLENVLRVTITKQITDKVNENMNQQHHDHMAQLAAMGTAKEESTKSDQILDLLQRQLAEKELELASMRQQLKSKEAVELELREQLTKSKDTIISIQQNEINKSERVEVETKRQHDDVLVLKQKLQEKEFENNRLGKSIEDLRHELMRTNREYDHEDEVKDDGKRRKGFDEMDADDYDHNKNNNPNHAIAVNVNVDVAGGGGGDGKEDDIEQPLLGNTDEDGREEKKRRHRHRDSMERIGQTPKEFFLDNHWACGFVCCDHACGFGSY